MTEQPSGRLYSLVTKHWPKIAAVLVGILGLTELILGGRVLTGWGGTCNSKDTLDARHVEHKPSSPQGG